MVTATKIKSYSLDMEEKANPIMVYTHEFLVWGEVVTKELIRVSTWLRTPMAPTILTVYDAQALYTVGTPTTLSFNEIHIPTPQVLAMHLMPPQVDPLDYDEKEPHRKMEPATAVTGPYRFDGRLRMSTSSTLKKYLDLMKETYTSMYEVVITQPQRPNIKPLHIFFVLVKRDAMIFSIPKPAA